MDIKLLKEKMDDFFENVTGEEIIKQLEELGYKVVPISETDNNSLINSTNDNSMDDYEFSTRQHWKEDKDDYDSPSIGGFSDY